MNTTEFAEVTVSVGVNSPLPLELKVVIAVLAGLSLVLLCLLYYCIRSSQSKNQKSVNMPDRERTNMFICNFPVGFWYDESKSTDSSKTFGKNFDSKEIRPLGGKSIYKGNKIHHSLI
ncbi:hypothetical protein Bpfe_007957 [Biomphalaria pfeifferi]|uniref:Uncharacterized protein n=1 Tax=Biomphalaria pfeifferi TaxID=112525 RepID=A0AAD8BZ51_BIOPF|nr:hypothetical protein Bpfe_007957 [Biomphalaria pfeifferi]